MTLHEQLQAALGEAYLLQRELAGGGMARVFLAEERSLHRMVVIKVLSSEMAAEVSSERFTREVQLAARLQHPNIVPLLTAGIAQDLPFYTMPYVTGESLVSRIREGPLPIADVITLLKDVSRALGYAHTHGVIHRDIKPANVLISGDAAVVTDFGIAKAIARSIEANSPAGEIATLTQFGTSVGTPLYMAPEQAAGDPACDHRADIYSLGAMAYELLTGKAPFAESTPQQLWLAKMSKAPVAVTERRPDTPALLATLVMRCLERNPDDRPQSAAEVSAALASVTGEFSGSHQTWRSRRAIASGIGAAAVIVAISVAATRALGVGPYGSALSSGAVEDQGRILIAEFEGGRDSSLTTTVTELFRLAFAQSRSIRTVDPTSLGPALQRMGRPPNSGIDAVTARELAQREGMAAVVEGQILGGPQTYVLTAKLVAPQSGEVLASADQAVKSDQDIIPAVGRLSTALRADLGESKKTVRSTPPLEHVSTTSLEALRKYTSAMAADRRQESSASTAMLREAVALDSNFAMAYRKLGNNLYWTRERAQAIEFLRKAYALRDRLTDTERNLLLGTYYSKVVVDLARSKAAFEAVLAVDPDNLIALDNVGHIARTTNDHRRAEEVYQHIANRWPTAIAMTNLATVQDQLGKFQQADSTFRAAIAMSKPGGNLAPWLMGLYHFGAARQYDSAEVYLRKATAWPGVDNTRRASSMLVLAAVVSAQGRVSEGADLFRDAAAIERNRGAPSGALVMELFQSRAKLAILGDRRAALQQVNSIRERVTKLPPEGWPVEFIATMYARLGQAQTAREFVTAHARLVEKPSAVDLSGDSVSAALIVEAEGRTDHAVAILRRRNTEASCNGCVSAEMGFVFDRAGQTDSAVTWLEHHIKTFRIDRLTTDAWFLAQVYRRLGELYEMKGRGREAANYFLKFADLWKRADPVLQPAVTEAKRRAMRISASL